MIAESFSWSVTHSLLLAGQCIRSLGAFAWVPILAVVGVGRLPVSSAQRAQPVASVGQKEAACCWGSCSAGSGIFSGLHTSTQTQHTCLTLLEDFRPALPFTGSWSFTSFLWLKSMNQNVSVGHVISCSCQIILTFPLS